MDAKKTAQQVLEQVGGAENVTFLTHCVTRLRFNLKSMDGVDEAKVKAVPVSGHHRQRSSCRVR